MSAIWFNLPMRFLGLIAIVLLFCAMIYFSILFWGMGRSVTIYTNDFLDKPTPWLAHPWDVRMDQSPMTDMEWVDVIRDGQGLLRVVPSAMREKAESELSKSKELTKTLKDYFAESKTCCAILNIMSNVTDIDTQVSAEIPANWDNRILVQSEFEPILIQLHQQRPLFVIGTSAADRVRWLTYRSLLLLPAVNFTRDVYITPLQLNHQPALSSDMIEEVHRRKRKVLIGPLQNEKETLEAKKLSPDGYFVLSKEAARPLFNNAP